MSRFAVRRICGCRCRPNASFCPFILHAAGVESRSVSGCLVAGFRPGYDNPNIMQSGSKLLASQVDSEEPENVPGQAEGAMAANLGRSNGGSQSSANSFPSRVSRVQGDENRVNMCSTLLSLSFSFI
jgi:hypothetical protein